MTTLIEDPTPILVVGILIEAVLAIALLRTGRGVLLWAMLAVAGLTGLGLLLERWVVTERERVEAHDGGRNGAVVVCGGGQASGAPSIDRRGSQFGDLPPDSRQSDCGYKLSFQTFEPPDHAKGNVARAVLYMHKQHNLPLVGTLEMYQRWHRLDPADADEKARNDNIARIQGNRNTYIDNPELVDRLSNMNNLGR